MFTVAIPFQLASAQTLLITVTIQQITQVESPDTTTDGDFYARVNIGNLGYTDTISRVSVDTPTINPSWTFSSTVDPNSGAVPIVIQVWDSDGGFAGGDNLLDINPADRQLDLRLIFDLTTNTWSGSTNMRSTQGDGDVGAPGVGANDGSATGITFDIGVQPSTEPTPIDVTVTIPRVTQIESPEPANGRADFFARVNIANSGFQEIREGVQEDAIDVSPFWQFTQRLDGSTGRTIPIVIQIWDVDDLLNFGGDHLDISPNNGVLDLVLTFDLNAKTWTGTSTPNQGFSIGDGDQEEVGIGVNDGPATKLLFDISVGYGDVDGDAIPDGVERFGIRDINGNVISNTAPFGFPMDPCMKTVAVEVDYMAGAADGHTHRPSDATLNQLVTIFNNSSVPTVSPCPFPEFASLPNRPLTGVNLVIDVNDQITEAATTSWGVPGGQFQAIKPNSFTPGREPYFHYNLWAHAQPNICPPASTCPPTPTVPNRASGIGEVRGNDFMVTLGLWGDPSQNGNQNQQIGTFMHELGHNLALNHGGADAINCKPNYLSVMHYFLQTNGVDFRVTNPSTGVTTADTRFDYSRLALSQLLEASLDENVGIGATGTYYADAITIWDSDGNAPWRNGAPTTTSNGALDWNGMNGNNENPVSADLNNLASMGLGDCPPRGMGGMLMINPTETLTGFNDWLNLDYNFRDELSYSSGVSITPEHPDITFEDHQRFQQARQIAYQMNLKIAKSVDLVDAIPGDVLNYEVIVRNIGNGPATGIVMQDNLPDDSTEIRRILCDIEASRENKTENLIDGVSLNTTDEFSNQVCSPDESGRARQQDAVLERFAYPVPFPIEDQTVLINRAAVTGQDLLANGDIDDSNNVASVQTVVHTPVFRLEKTATPSVSVGDPITYRITYENSGSGDAVNIVITDTIPANVYYDIAQDIGAGPRPDAVTPNVDGTTTLSWNIGSVSAFSTPVTIEYVARQGLLFNMSSDHIANAAVLDFTDANGNDYPALMSSAITNLTTISPTRNPDNIMNWANNQSLWQAEILARIQATDQRFDGSDGTSPDGVLSPAEIEAVLNNPLLGEQPNTLNAESLTTYFNLATGRINADTDINSVTANELGLRNVQDSILYARETLLLTVDPAIAAQYNNITRVLNEINNNQSESY